MGKWSIPGLQISHFEGLEVYIESGNWPQESWTNQYLQIRPLPRPQGKSPQRQPYFLVDQVITDTNPHLKINLSCAFPHTTPNAKHDIHGNDKGPGLANKRSFKRQRKGLHFRSYQWDADDSSNITKINDYDQIFSQNFRIFRLIITH